MPAARTSHRTQRGRLPDTFRHIRVLPAPVATLGGGDVPRGELTSGSWTAFGRASEDPAGRRAQPREIVSAQRGTAVALRVAHVANPLVSRRAVVDRARFTRTGDRWFQGAGGAVARCGRGDGSPDGTCTGTLIAPDVVLTAGRCVELAPTEVILNTRDYVVGGDRIPVKWARAYPDGGIATTPVSSSSNASPGCGHGWNRVGVHGERTAARRGTAADRRLRRDHLEWRRRQLGALRGDNPGARRVDASVRPRRAWKGRVPEASSPPAAAARTAASVTPAVLPTSRRPRTRLSAWSRAASTPGAPWGTAASTCARTSSVVGDGGRRLEPLAPVAEGVGRDVDDAHDDREPVPTAQRPAGPARPACAAHAWPPNQAQRRPGRGTPPPPAPAKPTRGRSPAVGYTRKRGCHTGWNWALNQKQALDLQPARGEQQRAPPQAITGPAPTAAALERRAEGREVERHPAHAEARAAGGPR